MANPDDINLTSGNDVYDFKPLERYKTIYGLAGDDKITIAGGANVVGGPGNDIIRNLIPLPQMWGGLAYWDSPSAITLDLEAGYCLDGWGGRDTISGFVHAHTSGHDGDTVYGSQYGEDIWINGFNWGNRSAGKAFADLRGGNDTVTINGIYPNQLTISATADGKTVTVVGNNYTATLKNVETLRLIDPLPNGNWDDRVEHLLRTIDLIDFSKVGAQTLLIPNQRGWSGGQVTYSFMTSAPSYGGADGGSGFVAPDAAYQGAVRTLFAKLGAQIGLSFIEVPDGASGSGQIRFGANQQTATKGYSFVPGTVPDDRAGDVWLDVETLALLQPGQEGWQVLLHEVGHALGLSHPIAEGTDTQATVLLNAWNSNTYTVMSPNQVVSGLWQSWYGPLDMQALRQLYGSRSSALGPGDDTYRIDNTQGFSLASLSDSRGADTLDASALLLGAYINLWPGSFSSLGFTPRGTASTDNLYIGADTTIENARGTAFDDVLLGNASDNLFWPDTGNDWVDGKGGFNVAIYDVPRSGYALHRLDDGSGAWVMDDTVAFTGSDTLINIQRVRFDDVRVALDIDGRAGQAARIAATVFGKSGLADPAAVGSVLQQLDAGVSVAQAYVNAVNSARFTQMAGGTSDMAFVKQMFRNLVNIEATDAMAQPFIDQYLLSGTHTKGSLAQMVSGLAPVSTVGLAQTGLDYLY